MVSRHVVADASLIAKWVVQEPDTDAARALIRRWVSDGTEIHGPPHALVEVAGVIRRHQRFGDFDLIGARRAIGSVLALPIALNYDRANYDRALLLADQFGRAIPDAMYLALAEQLGCELWTADEALVAATTRQLAWVKLLKTG